MTESEPSARLNIFALPSQTTLFFWLITLVLLGAAVAGNFYSGPPPLLGFALGLLILPLRAFLAYTEHKKAEWGLDLATSDEMAPLQARVRHLAGKLGLKRMPRLATSAEPIAVRVIGGWRHWYIVAGEEVLLDLSRRLSDTEQVDDVDALLTHELYHFKTGDYWQMEYLEVLFRVAVQFTVWMMFFLLGLILLLHTAARDVFGTSPEELARAVGQHSPLAGELLAQALSPIPTDEWIATREQIERINFGLVLTFIVTAMLPFVLLALILRFLFWPKFWRARELYADAGVVHTQGEALPLLARFFRIPLKHLRRYPQVLHTLRSQQLKERTFRQWFVGLRTFWYHPHWTERVRALIEPIRIYEGWRTTALLIGSLALLLDILLASPLTLPIIGDWPMHSTVLMVYVVVAFALLPRIIHQGQAWRELFLIVAVVVGIRALWLLITIALLVWMLLFNLAGLDATLQVMVASAARFFGSSDELAFESLPSFVMEASVLGIIQLVIVLLLLILALSTFHLLVQRLLTWYLFLREPLRFRRLTYAILLASGLFWGGIVLPLVTLALIEPSRLLSPEPLLIGIAGGLGALLSVGAFLLYDRRHAGCCPCGTREERPRYRLGKTCGDCHTPLHPWLLAPYHL
jgi:hypothetical protein